MPSLSLKKHPLQVQHQQQRSQQGSDEDTNLITLCAECHAQLHGRRRENYRLEKTKGPYAASTFLAADSRNLKVVDIVQQYDGR